MPNIDQINISSELTADAISIDADASKTDAHGSPTRPTNSASQAKAELGDVSSLSSQVSCNG